MEPETCAECGFDGTRLTTGDAITGLRSMGRRWREAFKDVPDETLRRRPEPNTWSPLEYAVHTRDVLSDNGVEMGLILEGRQPAEGDFEDLDDEPDVKGRTAEVVVAELAEKANAMADRAAQISGDDPWRRTMREGGPDAGWMLRHALHDASHHLRDVQRIIGLPDGGDVHD
jgi:hypothetical protein